MLAMSISVISNNAMSIGIPMPVSPGGKLGGGSMVVLLVTTRKNGS